MMKIINNKYSAWYNKIIEHARTRTTPEGYIERHHIIPRSLGGTNEPVNIVKLTAREHYICHLLLPKFLENINEQGKMWRALWIMSTSKKCKIQSRLFEVIRKENSIITILRNKDVDIRAKKSASRKGKTWLELYGIEGANARRCNLLKRTAQLKLEGRIGYKKGIPNLKLKNKKKSPEHCKALSEAHKGYVPSLETRAKLSAAAKGKTLCTKGKPWTTARRLAQLKKQGLVKTEQ